MATSPARPLGVIHRISISASKQPQATFSPLCTRWRRRLCFFSPTRLMIASKFGISANVPEPAAHDTLEIHRAARSDDILVANQTLSLAKQRA